MTWKIHQGDWIDVLRTMPDESVQCCVTSPPYWGLRDYGTALWEGGDIECGHAENVSLRRDSPGGFHNSTSRGTHPSTVAVAKQYADECRKCGAIRIDRQLGLERTPEEYVAKMVEGFREVRRVLRNDGTLWLNLGDSYANDGKWGGTTGGKHALGLHGEPIGRAKRDTGLKPKDLCGIPWMVAKALRDPYYTGRIKDERDRIWLASMIDGEGCIFIHKRKVGQNNGQGYERKHDSYGSGLEVANTHASIIERCQQITGIGSICTVERETRTKKRNIPLLRWNVRSNECRNILREIYPYLVGKQHEARLAIGCPSSGEDAERAHYSLMALHNAREANIDFKPPESMFQPGYYLRQDIIWSKNNPMPESVTDRCTKSHEYLFLLSKSARYYHDADAIKEDAVADHVAGNNNHKGTTAYLEQDGEFHRTKAGLVDYARRERSKRDSFKRENSKRSEVFPGQSVGTHRPDRDEGEWELESRNKRSVWTVATAPFSEAHFATFPTALIEPCILAGSREGDTVLDPFSGAGTTGLVATRFRRNYIGIELNPEYVEMSERRIEQDAPLFNTMPSSELEPVESR